MTCRRELIEAHQSRRSVGAGRQPRPVRRARPVGPVQAAHLQYDTIFTFEQFDAWMARLQAAELSAIDTETDSLDAMRARIVGISFSVEPGKAAYVPLRHDYAGAPDQLPFDEVIARLRPWLENPAARKVGQHIKYDRHVFANIGIEVQG